jgi:predicted lysophospholipase L1 biosynthesis ABC-type transport system permease subunit
MGGAKIERQISLPFKDAFAIALRNITIRLGRAAITGAGTLLGIAFLMSVFTSGLLQGDKIELAQQQKNTWLVVMSLLVTLVGITNSMLMSVTERYKEIGTMKCLGALDNFIVKLFLIESGLLGFFGALFGALIGGLFVILTNFRNLGEMDWGAWILRFGFCIIVGTILSVVAAIGPAIRAAKMTPIDAMRTEV